MQIVDAALPPDANVAKEARLALSSSASCFVHYITALCALSHASSPGLAVAHSWGWCRAWDCCKQRQKKVRFRTERGWLRSPRSTRLRRLIPSGRSARGGCVEQVLGPEDVLEAMKEAQLLPFRPDPSLVPRVHTLVRAPRTHSPGWGWWRTEGERVAMEERRAGS